MLIVDSINLRCTSNSFFIESTNAATVSSSSGHSPNSVSNRAIRSLTLSPSIFRCYDTTCHTLDQRQRIFHLFGCAVLNLLANFPSQGLTKFDRKCFPTCISQNCQVPLHFSTYKDFLLKTLCTLSNAFQVRDKVLL